MHAEFANALSLAAPAVPPSLRATRGLARRFDVYRNNSVATRVQALAASFPVTRALVGEAFFRAMAAARVREDPPRSPVLVEYGEGFAEFIATFAPAATVLYLADVARLEQARVRAFHAADAVPVPQAALAALLADPARLGATRVNLHPACTWLRSRHAVHAIWLAHHTATCDLRGRSIDMPQQVLVARPDLRVEVEPIDAAIADALDALHAGATLLQATAGLADATLVALFTLIVRYGLIVSLSSSTES
ncbi:hypothetical protein HNQ52_000080 [Chiayiivirga flava]|uniref:Putative DNA-binding domain-containing protein n=2 Tax=Chiayiivirga flava TaxID=659595 RepID=A0A7W8D2D4_9GAMM|nr:hypothetical protein [Chiayiivirga flava]